MRKEHAVDEHRFDQWARSLSSRRSVTTALAAGTLGAMLTRFGEDAAAARCINPGRKCNREDNKKDDCCGGAKCRGRRGSQKCRCPGSREACGRLCCAKGDICAGGTCVTGRADCPAGADTCVSEVDCGDNPDCECFQRFEGGTRCVQFLLPGGACDQCANDADCRTLGYPPGSSCIRAFGAACECESDDLGYCSEPCGFVPVEGNRTPARRGPVR